MASTTLKKTPVGIFEFPSFYFKNVVDRNILLYLASVAWIQQQSLKLGIHGKSIKFSLSLGGVTAKQPKK